MSNILYLASNGFASRMARALIEEQGQGEHMGLFTGNQSEFRDDRLIVRGRWYDNYLRKYSIVLFSDIKDNYTYECNTIRYNGRIYYRIMLLINVVFSKFFRLLKVHKFRDILLYDKVLVDLLENCKFEVFVIFYPASICDQRVLYNAGRTNKRVIIRIQSWDNILTKGYFYSKADEYHVWGNIMRNELIDTYSVVPSLIKIVGVPHFNKLSDTCSKKNVILFTMSSIFIAPGEIDIIEKLVKWLYIKHSDWKLVVRLHPQNLEGPYMSNYTKKYLMRLEKIYPNLALSLPILNNSDVLWDFSQRDSEVLDKLLSEATIVINSGSTITLEALLSDCYVLHTFFDGDEEVPYYKSAARIANYPHFKKIHCYNAYWNSYSFKELLELIERIIYGDLVFPKIEVYKLLIDQLNTNEKR